jgi:hypothetical protein
MKVLKRDDVPEQAVGMVPVEVPGLDGVVFVRTRMLGDRIALSTFEASLPKRHEGETESEAAARIGACVAAKTLALQVVLEDGTPVYGYEQWAVFGSKHPDDLLALFHKCRDMAAPNPEDVSKNSHPIRSAGPSSRSPTGWVARFMNWVKS